ncbi:MAG: cytochrome c peroxidase [Chloroherpetonaceae bacterium]|nr:cytochrome c peroxidase [Chloroherpetonaceae bacterium]
MKTPFVVVIALFVAFGLSRCSPSKPEATQEGDFIANEKVKALFARNLNDFVKRLEELDSSLRRAQDDSQSKAALQRAFKQARLAYKRLEFLTEYYAPSTSEELNGPALAKVGEEYKIEQPTGFQVLEEMMFPEAEMSKLSEMMAQTNLMRALCKRFNGLILQKPLTDNRVFDAMRLEIARVISLGISGFDSPVANHSIPEARAAIEGVREAFEPYGSDLIQRNPARMRQLDSLFNETLAYLARHSDDFNAFDRLEFIARFANPLSSTLLDAQLDLGIEPIQTHRPFSPTARTMFDEGAISPLPYAPDYATSLNPAQVELGRLLFYDPILSENKKRACASCHQPDKAFTDGLPRALTIAGDSKKLRNTPTILNAGFQASSSYDQKTVFLEDRVTFVVHSPDEMRSSLDKVAELLSQSEEYVQKFKAAFPESEKPISAQNIKVAIATYMRSLTSLNSRFDQYMRGDFSKMNDEEKRGFNLFMGKAKCGTCHFLPLFNGTVPPTFMETEAEVIGVPKEAKWKNAVIDPDIGKMAINGMELNKHMFKTPTVRNAELTAPYMHNGVYKTLDEVMRFYNVGGGAGIGIELPNQTLPSDSLGLSKQEIQSVIAFIKTLTDTTGKSSKPSALPKFSDATLNARKIGGEL